MDINSLHSATRNGSKEAEERLFAFLSVRFRTIAHLKIGNGQDAEDVAQNALTAIAEEYKTTEFSRSFAAWAYKVFDNRLLSYLGVKKRRAETPIESVEGGRQNMAAEMPNPDFRRRLLGCLRKVTAANPRYARVLSLHYQGYNTEDICGDLSVTPQNLYMLLSRARGMLKRCLDTGDVES